VRTAVPLLPFLEKFLRFLQQDEHNASYFQYFDGILAIANRKIKQLILIKHHCLQIFYFRLCTFANRKREKL